MIKCQSCPYKNTCVARIIDEMIVGCTMKDYVDGDIDESEIEVEKSITVKVGTIVI